MAFVESLAYLEQNPEHPSNHTVEFQPKGKTMKSITIALVLLFCLSSLTFAARLDTSFTFSTIETPHFSIHYHQGLEEAARKATVFAEEAHDKLTKEFSWAPGEKTQLVLIDDSDYMNGFATSLPYNIIYVQVVPPGLTSTLGEYDDWLKMVITHEYAHVVTSDPARGYWKVMRSIFGKPLPGLDPLSQLLFLVTVPPNNFLPRWWHEGMATWSETQFTERGRGKSTYYDMVFRMAVAGKNLPPVAWINGDIPDWPAGNLPYLYGYRLQQYIADTYGADTLGKLNIAHAGRFPYFINSPPQELTGGKSYRALYDDMIAALVREQSERIAALSTVAFTPVQTISTRGESLTNPRFSPDGSCIAYSRRDPHDHSSTVITDRSGSRVLAEFRRTYSDGSVCWSPDSGSLYFTQAEISNGFNTYQDLYRYDLATGSTARLTEGQRLGEVDLSPEGKVFVAVVSSRGSRNLVLLDVDSQGKVALPRLITDYDLQRVASPRWSPDGRNISYALTDNTGLTSLHIYDVASGEDRKLFTTSHAAAWPVWSRDGSVLFHISDETGVFNLFAYDLKGGMNHQVSHLLGGALQPDLSPDGREMIFSSYGSRGFSIEQMTVHREAWLPKVVPVLPPLRKEVAAKQAPVPVAAGVNNGGEPKAAAASVPYSSLTTLLPRFWLPRISADGSDSSVFGLFTAGADVLGYNSYVLTADYSPGRERGYFEIDYRNDYFYPTLFAKAHAQPFLYANLLQKGDYYELNQGVTVGASYPINFLESRYLISGGYQLQDQSALSALDSRGAFHGVSVFQGRRDNLFAGVSYENALKYPYSISTEEGRRVSLQYRHFGWELGGDRNYAEYSGQYQEFLPLPTAPLKHHILSLRLAGALADNNQAYGQQAFQIGGLPSELNPYAIRGYPARSATGKYVATGTLEYRAPLFFPLYGSGTTPAFAEKVHTALFLDAGEVWDDRTPFSGSTMKVGAGCEVRMDVTLGYWLKVTPALGYAHGFNQGGESQVYLTVYVDL
jgi:hypothetical protein